MDKPGVETDQRDMSVSWHLKALAVAAAALGLLYVLAIKTFL